MALSTEAAIMEALFARVALLTVGASPIYMPARIAWPNIGFTPPADQNFLRVVFVPNATERALIDSDGPHRHFGLLQLSVYWKKNDGETRPRDIAGQVAAHFPADLRLGSLPVRIIAAPNVADLIVEAARVQIPVMVPWEAWA